MNYIGVLSFYDSKRSYRDLFLRLEVFLISEQEYRMFRELIKVEKAVSVNKFEEHRKTVLLFVSSFYI